MIENLIVAVASLIGQLFVLWIVFRSNREVIEKSITKDLVDSRTLDQVSKAVYATYCANREIAFEDLNKDQREFCQEMITVVYEKMER